MSREFAVILVRPLIKPHYITTPEALADPIVFVRVNALQLLSWYGELGDPDFSFPEFAQIQYERELILQGIR